MPVANACAYTAAEFDSKGPAAGVPTGCQCDCARACATLEARCGRSISMNPGTVHVRRRGKLEWARTIEGVGKTLQGHPSHHTGTIAALLVQRSARSLPPKSFRPPHSAQYNASPIEQFPCFACMCIHGRAGANSMLSRRPTYHGAPPRSQDAAWPTHKPRGDSRHKPLPMTDGVTLLNAATAQE